MINFTEQTGPVPQASSSWVFFVDNVQHGIVKKCVARKTRIQDAIAQVQSEGSDALEKVLFLLAREYALRLLSRQIYSSKKLSMKLKYAGFPNEVIHQTLLFLQEKRYLDDGELRQAKIQAFIRSGKSQKEISYRLSKMGLSFAEFDLCDDEALVTCLTKKYPRWKEALHEPIQKRKLIASLLRRGFSLETLRSVFTKNS